MKRISLIAIAVFCAMGTQISFGAVKTLYATNVERLVTTSDGTFGGCMAQIDKDAGMGCKNDYVTVDCKGMHTSPADAYKVFELLQIAYVMNRPVNLRVNSDRRHSGYCLAERVYLREGG